MKISYAITVNDELDEIKRLMAHLKQYIRYEDEIVIQQDATAFDQANPPLVNKQVQQFVEDQSVDADYNIRYIQFPLQKDFARFKNNLKANCTGDYIFQIDADEYPNESLIENLPAILEMNPGVDLYTVPRVNTVDGITDEHIQRWGWRVNEEGWVNWPDSQMRIIANVPEIKWERPVHEVIVGFKQYSHLPLEEEYALYHPKNITKQEKQNAFYDTI